jgi:hypothetical protein
MSKAKSKPPTEVQQHRITVAERKKAEELVRAKFATLVKAVDNEVATKLTALHNEWAKARGVKKILAKIKHHEAQVEKLREQLTELSGNRWYDGIGDRDVKMHGEFGEAKERLLTAQRVAKEELGDKRNEAIKQLWFSLLSEDARDLLDAIPTIRQLKNNGLALLSLPVKKLLKGT